jgi:hypothetical protein
LGRGEEGGEGMDKKKKLLAVRVAGQDSLVSLSIFELD